MLATVIIIINLIILESLLSVDNAAVLAIMVRGLPPNQRSKALKYGIWGAYIMRGICLFIAVWLVKFAFLKIAGGLYLVYLAVSHFRIGDMDQAASEINSKPRSFWGTVFMVEVMDIIFSIDNVFAAVALSDKFWVIMTGVGIGILAMRFVATKFVDLMEKYPSLAKSAYIVILLLGLKLVLDGTLHYTPFKWDFIGTHLFDTIFSASMMLIFFVPLLKKQIPKNALRI